MIATNRLAMRIGSIMIRITMRIKSTMMVSSVRV